MKNPKKRIKLLRAEIAHIQVLLDMMSDFNALYDYPFNRSLVRELLQVFLNDSSLGRLWLITLDDQIIGYLVVAFGFSFEYHGRDALIDELYIEEKHRGQGLGSEVLDQAFALVAELQIKVIHLEVEPENLQGTKLYQRHGFRSKGRNLLSKHLDR
ncbi:MAG: GNAT family N-acetyltransferase [Saprospiraceae bacterium]|nr:GNAT family N-acetyltransferase [Saprospiraceae bacterium]